MTTTLINFKTRPELQEKAYQARSTKSKNGNTKANYYSRGGLSKVANLQLPEEVVTNFKKLSENNLKSVRNDYIIALVNSGWTAISVSKAAGLSNEMVRIIMKTHTPVLAPPTLNIPEVPRHEPKSKGTYYSLPSTEVLERLKELKPLAQKVRSNSKRYREEAEEYSRLINYANTVEGVTLYRLGKLLEVSTSALVFRLVRYGYKVSEEGKSKSYQLIKENNRKK